jgi:hypothetical protein
MAQNENKTGGQKDDPRQALEEGDPKLTGRTRGRPVDEQGLEGAGGRTDPDMQQHQQGKKDAAATTPHRESGDR